MTCHDDLDHDWTDAELGIEERKSFWKCQECGHEDHQKPMPLDRAAFYEHVHKKASPKCPKCKSESFMPVGF